MKRQTKRKVLSTVARPVVEPARMQVPLRRRNINTFALALGCFLALLVAGIGYALYLRMYCDMPHHGWKNHLLQWWPFVSAIGALVFGVRKIKTDTAFAEFGLMGCMAVAMPCGYVLGRMLFF